MWHAHFLYVICHNAKCGVIIFSLSRCIRQTWIRKSEILLVVKCGRWQVSKLWNTKEVAAGNSESRARSTDKWSLSHDNARPALQFLHGHLSKSSRGKFSNILHPVLTLHYVIITCFSTSRNAWGVAKGQRTLCKAVWIGLAATFFDASIQKLVPRYEKRLNLHGYCVDV